MPIYWWPGFEKQLLGELQRQQNSTQFCDTLLQTEGISVPAHSCILAALSPYLSQKLSASPPPAPGEKRLLQLQPVKAQTLLKLVGLLYSGEVEVKGTIEQNDVLAVARVFGIKDLVEGDKNGMMEEQLQEKMELLGSFKDNSIHARDDERKESRKMQDPQVRAEMAGRRDVDLPAENRNCVTTGTQTGEKPFGDRISLECAPLDEQFCPSSCPMICNLTSRALNDAKATLDRSSSLALCNDTVTFPRSLNSDTNYTENHYQSLQALVKKTVEAEDGKTIGQILDSRENIEEPRQTSRGGILGEENGNSTEKRHPSANVGTKNLANMKQMHMLETTQISVKVKLRRRTKGEVWEVVSQQDSDETLTVLASHKQDGFSHKRLQKNPSTGIVEPNGLSLPPHPNTSCGCEPPSCDFNLNQNDGLGTTPCSQHQGNVEESDEQIEKLLEDIMMGLNILPNLEKEFKKSHDVQPSHVGVPTSGQVPVTQNIPEHGPMPPAVSPPGCTFCQDMGTLSGHSASDMAQNLQLDVVEIPLQKAPGQDTQHILEHVLTVTGVETESEHTVFLSCMDDLRIPQCLSPLDPGTSETTHQSIPYQGNFTDNLTTMIQQQASVHGRPWLTENSGCLQFPLSAITHTRNKTIYLAPDTNCGLKQQQQEKQTLNPQNGGIWAESDTMKQVEERETIVSNNTWQQDGRKLNSEPRMIKHSLKCKQADTSGDLVAPKKRKRPYTSHLQDTASLSAYEDMTVADGTKCIKMSKCSVSLSSNNILAKEREMSISSLNVPSRLKGKAYPHPSAESLKEKTKETTRNTDRTRTRGFMKKNQGDSLRNTKPSVPIPVACRASTVNNVPLIKRKRGRPSKAKLQDNNVTLVHEKYNGDQSQDNPVFLSDLMQEEGPQMANEEKPLKNQNEGKSCDAAESNTTQCTDLANVEGLRTTGSEEEEEEVDILLVSPHNTPCVTAPNMEMHPEEEEDMNETEIDVTGDEAE